MTKPASTEEVLAACKERLQIASENLRVAHQRITELEIKVEHLKNENQTLKKSRGLVCKCQGNCLEHHKTKPKKRKPFASLTVNGRRRGLKEIRDLFKVKQSEYDVPVSTLAGFIIQQVAIVQKTPK